jgi:hypothetical protein
MASLVVGSSFLGSSAVTIEFFNHRNFEAQPMALVLIEVQDTS